MIGSFAWPEASSRWILALAGVVALVLGGIILSNPQAGGVALVWTIGVYGLSVGAIMFALGVRSHVRARTPQPTR
jgi:uncharacterized membrane protein HdeD (DUF308 family)